MSDSAPFQVRVALGLVRGWRLVRIFGDNHDADTGIEDVWRYGGVKALPTSAATVSLVSTSTADAAAGTGARSVLLDGLNANYERITEVVALNGTTPVSSSNSFLRLNLVRTTGVAGSSGANVGDITATIGGSVQAFIAAGLGRSQMAHYTVEANHRLVLFDITSNVGQGKTADTELSQWIRLYEAGSHQDHGPWLEVNNVDLYEGGISVFGTAVPTEEKADIRWQVETTANNLRVSVTAHGFLIQKGFEGST